MQTVIKTLLGVLLAFTLIVTPSLSDQAEKAYADPSTLSPGKNIGNALDGAVVEMTLAGSIRCVNIQNDGGNPGDDVQLFHLGTSSKALLTWDAAHGGYVIQNQKNFTEQYLLSRVWDVKSQSKSSGAILHVQNRHKGGDADAKSQNWLFEQNSDGSYYIKNVRSGRYIGIRDGNEDGSNLIQVDNDNAKKFNITVLNGSDSAFSYSTYADSRSWMRHLADDIPLSRVSLPGTHDSGTVNADDIPDLTTSAARTQKYYIDQQLAVGIRYFDIRCGEDKNGDPGIFHTVKCMTRNGDQLRLSHVMNDALDFLSKNESETIIMLISKVSGGSNSVITHALEQYIKDHPDRFWNKDTAPTLGEARGKIVLMRRFDLTTTPLDSKYFGVDLQKWSDNDYKTKERAQEVKGSKPMTWVQDHYGCSGSTKIDFIEGTLTQASSIPLNNYLINYTSCTQRNPFSATRYVFNELNGNKFFTNNKREFIGILPMDFVDANWAKKVYMKNFGDYIPQVTFPTSATLTYGECLKTAKLEGQSASVEGYFEFLKPYTYPDFADSETTPYRMRFVERLPDKSVRYWDHGEITVKVEQREITLAPISTSMEYGTTSDDPDYADPANIPYLVTKGSILPEDQADFQISFAAVDNGGNKIPDTSDAATYNLGSFRGSGGSAYNYHITYQMAGATYTISPRQVTLKWTGTTVSKVGDAVGSYMGARVANLVNSDDCTVSTIQHYKDNGFGELGDLVTDGNYQTPGFYWAVATTLSGGDAGNYTLGTNNSPSNNVNKIYKRYYVRGASDPFMFPDSATLEYGENISEAELEGGSGDGTFEVVQGSLSVPEVPQHAATYLTEYKVRFTPNGIDQPEDQPIKLTVTQKPLKAKALRASSQYGNELPSFDFVINPNKLIDTGKGKDTKESLDLSLAAIDGNGDNLAEYNTTDQSGAAFNTAPVGTYDIVGASTDVAIADRDYLVTLIPGIFEITPRKAAFTWSGHEDLTYSGAETNVVGNITNLVPAGSKARVSKYDDCSLVVEGGQVINAGDYRAVITGLAGSDASNYELQDGIALFQDFSVAKAKPQVKFAQTASLEQGRTLSEAALDNTGSSSVPGDFSFLRPEFSPELGTHAFFASFEPADTTNYLTVYGKTEVTTKATPGPTPGPDPDPKPDPKPNPDPVDENADQGLARSGDSPTLLILFGMAILAVLVLECSMIISGVRRGRHDKDRTRFHARDR